MRDGRKVSPAYTRAKLEDIAAINCLFAEFDAKAYPGGKPEARQHAERVKLPPNILVDSGGGYHAYWLLHAPVMIKTASDLERLREIQYRWVELVGSDPDSKDLARVLRMPGTYNFKYDPPREVLILYADYDIPYELSDLTALLPPPAPKPQPNPAPLAPIGFDAPKDPCGHWLDQALKRLIPGDERSGRNATGYWLAQQLIWDGVGESDQERVMLSYAERVRHEHPAGQEYTDTEALNSLRSARNLPAREPARGRGNALAPIVTRRPAAQAATSRPNGKPVTALPKAAPVLSQTPSAPINNGGAAAAPTETEVVASTAESEEPPAESQNEAEIEHLLRFAPYDHDGHALCLRTLYPRKFAWCEKWGWLFYNGKCWLRDGAEGAVSRAIIQTLKRRREVGKAMDGGDLLVKASKGNASNINGIKDVLAAYTEVFTDDFDKHPDGLNCQNGVLNLRTGKLLPHSPKQHFTYVLPIAYDPQADYQQWTQWLLETVDQQEIVDYLQVALGYSLTGHTYEEVMFYLFGKPRSGKGTFTETILAVLGKPLGVEADMATFTSVRNGDTSNFDLAPLKPCRFVAASESGKNAPLNPEKIKAMTGRNQIRCSFKHKTHFEYQPAFKIWLSSNHPVNVDVEDDAAWGRMRVIDFPNSHLGNEDKTLKIRFTTPAMLRGVLRWAVEGAQIWYEMWGQKTGLPLPEMIRISTEQQREQQDFIKQCLEECFANEDDRMNWITTGEAYQAYKSWCENIGVVPKYHNQFSQSLSRRGHPIVSIKVQGKTYRKVTGLKLA
jgi:putative DNA primase/helicase